jgi:hypothetical protein
VGERHAVGVLTNERRTGVEDLTGAGVDEHVAGDRPAVQVDGRQLLDGDRGQGGDSRPHGMAQRRRHGVATDELLEEQRVAARELNESRPRVEVETRVQLACQLRGRRWRQRWNVHGRHATAVLDRQ